MNIKMVAGLFVAGVLLAGAQLAVANGDDGERGGYRNSSMERGRGSDFAAVDNPKYAKECGSCHMAYQPGLLPERSWRKMMENLHDHFGENAELADADRQEITDYLARNSAEKVNYKRSAQFVHSIAKSDTPLRITKVPHFVKEHREVANKIRGSDKIKSLSQCEQCHQRANDGSYSESEINVPGIGRWED